MVNTLSQVPRDVQEAVYEEWRKGERRIQALATRYRLKRSQVRQIIWGEDY